MDAMDDAMLALESHRRIPTEVLQRLPPWRAVMVAKLGIMAGFPLFMGSLEQMRRWAYKHSDAETMGNWWEDAWPVPA
jgi:hypothetical protein